MTNKIISILKVCISFFVLLYAAYIYRATSSISIVTVILLVAGLAPALHMAWNYLKIKMEEYQDQYFRNHLGN